MECAKERKKHDPTEMVRAYLCTRMTFFILFLLSSKKKHSKMFLKRHLIGDAYIVFIFHLIKSLIAPLDTTIKSIAKMENRKTKQKNKHRNGKTHSARLLNVFPWLVSEYMIKR